MLRDAALLQLELLRRALDENLILKDSSSYNVQWRGTKPVFIDVGSFERLRAGRAVGGLPAVLHALPQPAAAPGVQGRRLPPVAPREPRRDHAGRGAAACSSSRDLFRRGVLTNVALHARLERKHDESSRDVKTELKRAGFKKELIVANVRRLEKLVRGLEWKPGATRVVGVRGDDVLRRGRRRAQGGVRPRGRPHARVEPRLGHRLQRRPPLAHRRRERALRRRARRRRGRRRPPLPLARR